MAHGWADVREGGSARTGQFCPKRAMLEAIDHAISVVRLTRTDRMAEEANGAVDTGLPGQLDTDCPRSASDDPRGSLSWPHAKTPCPRRAPAPGVAAVPGLRPPSPFPVYGEGHIKRNM